MRVPYAHPVTPLINTVPLVGAMCRFEKCSEEVRKGLDRRDYEYEEEKHLILAPKTKRLL